MSRRRRFGLLALFSAAAFLLFLSGPDIVTSHEARVALPARQMADAGWPWAARPAMVAPVVLRPGVVRLAPDWNAPPEAVNPWLVPVLSGQVRLQKPPLPYWCAAITFRLFGFNEFTLRLIPALLGMLATVLVYDLGRMLMGRRAGWLAGLIWVSTYAIPEEYRKAMADPYLAFFTLGCVWAWIRAAGGEGDCKLQIEGEGRTPATRQFALCNLHFALCNSSLPASVFLLLFYLSFALALLAKGPPAVVDILIPLAAFHLCYRRRLPGNLLAHLGGLGVMLAIALPWPWYVWRQVPHAMELWRYESVGELMDNTENARPGWFYLPQVFFLSLPWTAVWLAGVGLALRPVWERLLAWLRRRLGVSEGPRGFAVVGAKTGSAGSASGDIGLDRLDVPMSAKVDPTGPTKIAIELNAGITKTSARRARFAFDPRLLFPLLWYAVTVIFFSFVHLKKNQYLLPALPASVLLAAGGMTAIFAAARRTGFRGWPGAFIALQTIVGIAFAVGVPGIIMLGAAPSVRNALVMVPVVVFALLPLRPMWGRRVPSWALMQTATYVLVALAFWRLCFVPQEDLRSAKNVAGETLALAREPGRTLLISRLPEEVAVYLPLDVRYGVGGKVLVVVDDQRDAHFRQKHKLPEPAVHVGQFAGWLPDETVAEVRRLPLKSAPGDARWKVYELTVQRSGVALR
ncbi:MAG: glycosyl transferase family 39 [Phycisphaerales bacterium]|nr:glycosyl transferase family 39 [Phycisphaerales bacterium]